MNRTELIQRIKEIAISLPQLDNNVLLLLIKQGNNTFDVISDEEILKIINNIKTSSQIVRGLPTIDVIEYLQSVNTTFDKSQYTEIQKLGEGAYGTISKYQSGSTFVAVKAMDYDDMSSSLVREVGCLSILKLLESKYIPIFCGFRKNELCLELADSDLFKWWVDADDKQLKTHLPRIVDDLLNGLSDMQSVGLVNADIKPQNMLIWYNGNEITKVAYTDFGLCTSYPEDDTIMYTVLYRPPEYFKLPRDGRLQANYQTDCWALAKSILQLCMTEDEFNSMFKIYTSQDDDKIYKYQTTVEIPNAPTLFKRYLRPDQVQQLTRMISVDQKDRCVVSVKALSYKRDWKISLTEKLIVILFDWMADVAKDHRFRLKHHTLLLSYDLLTRYLKDRTVDRGNLQGYSAAALYLASLWGGEDIDIRDFVYITNKAYTSRQIDKFSFDILQGLDGLVWIPGLEKLEEKFNIPFKDLKALLTSVNFDISKI